MHGKQRSWRTLGASGSVAVAALVNPASGAWSVPAAHTLRFAAPPGERAQAAAPVRSAESLDAAYQACATAYGFDPGGVQVLTYTPGGTPVWVKTGRDVPAAIHRPCFVRIGGTDPHRSSHGYPAP